MLPKCRPTSLTVAFCYEHYFRSKLGFPKFCSNFLVIDRSGIVIASDDVNSGIAVNYLTMHHGCCCPVCNRRAGRNVAEFWLESDMFTSQMWIRNSAEPRHVRSSTWVDLFGNRVYLFFYLPSSFLFISVSCYERSCCTIVKVISSLQRPVLSSFHCVLWRRPLPSGLCRAALRRHLLLSPLIFSA